MSASRIATAPRQSAILATIAGLHAGAFMLVMAGLHPRLPWLEAPPPPIIRVLPSSPPPLPVEVPRQPEPVEYLLPGLPEPVVLYPEFKEAEANRAESDALRPSAAGSGPDVPVPDLRAPALHTRGGRLAALVDACYPAASRRLGEEGRVMVRVDIDATGGAAAWNIVDGSGFARLDAAVACVIRPLEFIPGRRNGEAAAASATLPIVFRLD